MKALPMQSYPAPDHLQPFLVTLDALALERADSLVKMKVRAARLRHAELHEQLRRLESEAEEADNRHVQDHIMKRMELLRPQIRAAYAEILPYTRK